MKSIMAKAETSTYAISAALKTIWYVEADAAYDVTWIWKRDDSYVAVRTLRGSGVMQLKENQEHVLKEGSLLVMKLSDVIGYRCKEHQWVFYWFEFSANGPVCLLDNAVPSLVQITAAEIADMKQCFSLLHGRAGNHTMLASAVFSRLLTQWLMGWISDDKLQERIEPALQYILYHAVDGISIPALAAMCHMSERSFRNQFISCTGMPPQKYIESKRMDMAKELLEHTALQLKDIAEYLGYDNQYYFSRCFKRNFHITPSQYRKMLLENK